MNNQAAQTMPELPEPAMPASSGGVEGNWEGDTYPDLYDADQMRAMYQQGYAAALAQTAGVVDDAAVIRLAEWFAAGNATVYVNNHPRGQKVTAETYMAHAREALNAASAPAASGGEVSHVTIDFPQVGTAGPFKVIDGRMTLPDVTMNDLIHHARMGYAPAPNPPAAASASERARALLAAEYERANFPDVARTIREGGYRWDSIRALELRAIEQALAQQRDTTPQPSADAVREATAYIESYECDGTTKQGLVWADHPANTPGHWFTPLYTTPPSPGDARLRELANKWRERSASMALTSYTGATLDKCADELESLLSGGSHA